MLPKPGVSYRVLRASLPVLDPLYRVDQHKEAQDQAVPDPQEQDRLHRDEQHQRTAEPQPPDQQEPEAAHRDVAQRVDDGVPEIAESGGPLAVPPDDKLRVLDQL